MSIERRAPDALSFAPKEINKKTTLRAYIAEWKRRNRRKVKPGFPKPSGPISLDDMRKYLNAVEIDCFLCGRAFRELGRHLASIHSLGVDDYREMYGLPYRVGLTCVGSKEYRSERFSTPAHLAHLARVRPPDEARRDAPRRSSAAHKMQSCINAAKARKPERIYGRQDAERVIEIMEKNGVSLNAAVRMTGNIKHTTFWTILRENEDLWARYAATPFPKRNPSTKNRIAAVIRMEPTAGNVHE